MWILNAKKNKNEMKWKKTTIIDHPVDDCRFFVLFCLVHSFIHSHLIHKFKLIVNGNVNENIQKKKKKKLFIGNFTDSFFLRQYTKQIYFVTHQTHWIYIGRVSRNNDKQNFHQFFIFHFIFFFVSKAQSTNRTYIIQSMFFFIFVNTMIIVMTETISFFFFIITQ